MRVETDPFPSDRGRKKQPAARPHHTLKVFSSQPCSLGVQRVTISTEAYVLDHMETGERGKTRIGERQARKVPCHRVQTWHAHPERPIIDEDRFHRRAQNIHHHHTGPDIDMKRSWHLMQSAREPGALVKIVRIEGCLADAIQQARIGITPRHRTLTGQPLIAPELDKISWKDVE